MEIAGKIENIPVKNKNGDYIININIGPDDYIAKRLYDKYNHKPLSILVDKFRKKRSLEANNYLWVCIRALAEALGNDNWDQYLIELERYGTFISTTIREDAYPDVCNKWRETKIVGEKMEEDGHLYYYVNCYFGSSTYNSKEFARLLNGVLDDMKEADVDIPVRTLPKKG